jgi:hypothetical protein
MPYDLDSIDGWNVAQCEECMKTYNESYPDVDKGLEFYKQHCRHLVADDARGLAMDLAMRVSSQIQSFPVQVYLVPWGSYWHRFDAEPLAEVDGVALVHVATYRNGIEV